MISTSSSSDCGPSLLQIQKDKLVGFFDMSLEALCQTKSLDEVESIALKILDQATDPLEKSVMNDLVAHLANFKETVPASLSAIESSHAIESCVSQMTKNMEARLVNRKGQLTSLEAEVSRLGEEGSKLDCEIQQLTAHRAKIFELMNSTEAELEKANWDASKELNELKDQHDRRKQAGQNQKIADEELAQSNAS